MANTIDERKQGKKEMICKKIIVAIFGAWIAMPLYAASVIATIDGKPITDTDVTMRTQLLSRVGKSSTDNRHVAFNEIVNDAVKIKYASNFNAIPDDDIVDAELKKTDTSDMSAAMKDVARNALRAEIAWQIIVGRTILPTINVTDEDVATERAEIARQTGLPIEMTIVRLTDIPQDVAAKLTRPKNCDDAMEMARGFGGVPQKFTALQYELSADIRERVAGLPNLTWSPLVDDSVLLVCNTKKTDEYGKLDDVIRQNAQFKQAMFIADQQLKQLRRRAVIIINDQRYKL